MTLTFIIESDGLIWTVMATTISLQLGQCQMALFRVLKITFSFSVNYRL